MLLHARNPERIGGGLQTASVVSQIVPSKSAHQHLRDLVTLPRQSQSFRMCIPHAELQGPSLTQYGQLLKNTRTTSRS